MSSEAVAQQPPAQPPPQMAQYPAPQVNITAQVPTPEKQEDKVPLAHKALKIIKTLELIFRIGHAIFKGAKEGLIEYLDEQNTPPPQPQTPQETAARYGPPQQ